MATPKTSVLQHFYKKNQEQRLHDVAAFSNLTDEDLKLLKSDSALPFALANRMIENVVGIYPLPLAIATNFAVNGKDFLIPMAIEEASVVAAASNAAKLARAAGGFTATATEPLMIAQIQVVQVPDMTVAKDRLMAAADELVRLADEVFPSMKQFGGGAKSITCREIDTQRGKQLIVHLVVNVRDAMGANSVNSMAEGISPRIEQLTGGKVRLRILTNLAVLRTFKARAVWKKDLLSFSTGLPGDQVVEAILDAWAFADADQFRGTTHNKGIMNGIDAVTVATGNDWRAVEAGAHSFAAYNRKYTSLTRYSKDAEGNLVGEIELPLALGKIGGATGTHPVAKLSLRILNIESAQEFGMVVASVGLAQNFAALRALATEGIQRGHMKLHAKHIAMMAGATGEVIDIVAKKITEAGKVDVLEAKKVLAQIQTVAKKITETHAKL